jgi:hypothetical protein
VIAPEIGQVTDAVASSPTPPLSGVHSETSAVKEYEGDVEFFNLSALDVVYDTSKEYNNHDW